MNLKFYLPLFLGLLLFSLPLHSGNPDRQGEAGAYELLMNPWARSAGLHTMPTSLVRGVEAMNINIAGLSRISNKLEVVAGHSIHLQGTGLSLSSVGVATKMGKNSMLGISLMSLDFGDIRETTVDQPEGTGAFFSPPFFNLGVGYAHMFENKISVGFLVRLVSESVSDLSAFGFALDAGVQYVTGEQDNFKFGISLRNIGSPMRFQGEGLTTALPVNEDRYELSVDQRSASFELPSMLNIGLSYDFRFGESHRLTMLGNFTSNSFSRDQIGGGIEYSLKDIFMIRGGYRYSLGELSEAEKPIYTGLSAGASVEAPLSRENKNMRIGFDYAYRVTKIWNGSHNFSVRINI